AEAQGTEPPAVPSASDLELELYAGRVRYTIRQYYTVRAQTCFEQATRNEPNVRGTVVVTTVIGATGEVTDSHVARNSTGSDALGKCLAAQIKAWRLPEPPEAPIELDIPFSR
ncbi:MAG: TonB family protein, partial [Myxococcales bacterium]|nr:TonB family protein [Myxococcales bacterium]